MQICERHWAALRQAIDDRGLTSLVAKNGEVAQRQTMEQLRSGGVIEAGNFDPLMMAHWLVINNTLVYMQNAGFPNERILYLFTDGPEAPVTDKPGYESRTWPRCPLCHLNLAHETSCGDHDKGCRLAKVDGYDWMIVRAAEDALAKAREFKLAPLPS